MPQSLSVNYVHVIFSTKNRLPFLADRTLRNCVNAGLADITRRLNCPAILVNGGADHVHLLIRLHQTVAIASWIQELKRASSIWVKELRDVPDSFAWQNGYAAFSVSASNLDTVRDYIANQEDHHRNLTFQDEYRAFLRKHSVEWDERYVWD